MDVLDAQPRVIDVGTQIGHSPLRAYVMGERGASNERATVEDISLMSKMVEEAMTAALLHPGCVQI